MPEVISSVDRTTGKDLFKIARPRCTRRRCASMPIDNFIELLPEEFS
jgi:hypothetical protein